MLNSLNLGTDGALKRGAAKAVLVLGVAGMLYFGSTPVPPTPPSGGGGGGGYVSHYDENKERRDKIRIEDSWIVAIVEVTLKTTII